MTRRGFICKVVGAIAGIPAAFLWAHTTPARFIEAVRARIYPGRVRKLEFEDLRGPSRWAG